MHLGRGHGRPRRVARGTLLDDQGPSAVGFYTTGQLFLEEYYTLGARRTWWHPDQPRRRQHPALHGHRCGGPQGVLRLRRPAGLLHRRRPRRRDRPLRTQRRRDPDSAVDAHSRSPRGRRPARRSSASTRGRRRWPRQPTVHLAPRPGTNVALMNALLHEVIASGHVDQEWVQGHTVGYDDLEKLVGRYSPDVVSAICDVPADDIRGRRTLAGRGGGAALDGAPGLLPVPSGHGRGRPGQQPAPAPRHDRSTRLRHPPDERPADCGEHARVRRRRRHGGLPQLEQPSPRRRPCSPLERRAEADSTRHTTDARHADHALRRGRIDPAPLGVRDEPSGVDARARPDAFDPLPGPALPRRAGHLPHRDGAARRRRASRRGLGREDRCLHERRPDGASLRAGSRAAWRGTVRPRDLHRFRPANGLAGQGRSATREVDDAGGGVRRVAGVQPWATL